MKRFFISFVLICALTLGYLFFMVYPVKVSVKLLSYESMQNLEPFSSWKIICEKDDSLYEKLQKSGIKIPEIDFRRNNLLVSCRKEITVLSYQRISRFRHPLKENLYLGKANYGNEVQDLIYFYQIPKVPLTYNIFVDPI